MRREKRNEKKNRGERGREREREGRRDTGPFLYRISRTEHPQSYYVPVC